MSLEEPREQQLSLCLL